ncbi:hypothetical protein HPP92_015045 [Vanilla planifolia]|uniref:Late embryogenesis abundant protein LEA-2 subgroup domain-containing protein n=1 Tax=Vanilla planifolia TaxID=51239 RepID=A0A835QKF9_VANPL|nr:hypothetical protein HPP92_015045 [Vanilla planifolia]
MSLTSTASPRHCAAKHRLYISKFNKKLLSAARSSPSATPQSRPEPPSHPLARLLNSTIQATIVSKNPNARVGVYYDRLRACAVYKGQQITADASLPPFYQGHGDINLLSASLAGTYVPVSPSIGYEVRRDQTTGKLLLHLRLDGQLRWKVGSWVSRRQRFDVDCIAAVVFASGGFGEESAVPVGSARGAQCSTNV